MHTNRRIFARNVGSLAAIVSLSALAVVGCGSSDDGASTASSNSNSTVSTASTSPDSSAPSASPTTGSGGPTTMSDGPTATISGGERASSVQLYGACGVVGPQDLRPIFDELSSGKDGDEETPYGKGKSCLWTNNANETVRLVVIEGADIAAWVAEAADGDGVEDGTVVSGLGDKAFVGEGAISFSTGSTLVRFTCLPTSGPTEQELVALATAALPNL